MVSPVCDKCRGRNVGIFKVEPEEVCTVVLNRWRNVCPCCFDGEGQRNDVGLKQTLSACRTRDRFLSHKAATRLLPLSMATKVSPKLGTL